MTITIQEIVAANQVFTKILESEFSGSRAFKIGRVLRALNTETEEFNKAREKILRRYAETDDAGEMIVTNGNVKLREDSIMAFQTELNDLLQMKLNVDIQPIPFEWLEDIKLTPQEVISLDPFIVVNDEENK